jgi:hypothetical protein
MTSIALAADPTSASTIKRHIIDLSPDVATHLARPAAAERPDTGLGRASLRQIVWKTASSDTSAGAIPAPGRQRADEETAAERDAERHACVIAIVRQSVSAFALCSSSWRFPPVLTLGGNLPLYLVCVFAHWMFSESSPVFGSGMFETLHTGAGAHGGDDTRDSGHHECGGPWRNHQRQRVNGRQEQHAHREPAEQSGDRNEHRAAPHLRELIPHFDSRETNLGADDVLDVGDDVLEDVGN